MRWASVLALTVRVDATHSLGDAPPGNSTALPLALAAVRLLTAMRLLAVQIHGCVDVSIGDYLGGLSLFVVSVGGGRWWWASVQLLAYVTLLL